MTAGGGAAAARRAGALALCLALACAPSASAEGAASLSDDVVRFVNTGMREGLANASVSSMVQDAAGFIWIGTQGGLHRWDGRSFALYENEPFDASTLPHNLIQTMFLDDDGTTLWIGTYGGLSRFDTRTERFESWSHDPADPRSLCNDVVVSVARDADGRLWVGTLEGLDRMDGDGFVHYYAKDSPDPSALSAGTIRSLFRDSRGDFWVGTSGGGLYRYLKASDSFEALRSGRGSGLRSDFVFSIREDRSGALWLGLWNFGISKYEPAARRFTDYPLDDGRVYFVNADEPGLVRAGTWGGGLFELDEATGKVRRFQRDISKLWSLPHDTMYSMLVDSDGNVWIGTNGGGFSQLMRDPGNYRILEHDPSDPSTLSSGKAIAVLEDSRGRLWVGMYNGGVNRLDPGASGFRHYRHDPGDASSLPNDIVVHIYEDRRGSIWFLTNDGMARYDEASDSFDRVERDPRDPDSISDDVLYVMLEEPGTGNYWIGTYTHGIEYWDVAAGRFVHYPSVSGDASTPSDNLVYCLAYDAGGRLWAGTNGGLCRYEGDGRWKRYGSFRDDTASLPSKIVRDLLVDSSGALWVATNGGGVARYEESTDSFQHWTKRDGLSSNIVLSLLEGEPGTVWASTTTGLSLFDRSTGRWSPFFDKNRLRYGEFCAGRYKGRDGSLYFGALNALYVIDPSKAAGRDEDPDVLITSIRLGNRDLDAGLAPWFVRSVMTSWKDNSPSFSFTAIDFNDPGRVQYAYMLEGFDEVWVYSGSRGYASYTNLPGGRAYEFRVKASNGAGVWGEDYTSVTVEVEPAPWSTWWAISLYVLLALGLLWVLSVARSRAMLRAKVNELSRLKSQLEQANVKLGVLAAHDGLTGLLNRRSLDEELSRRFASALRLDEPLSALMIDIDHFKPYNDRYGHQLGDECLIQVAQAIRLSLERPQDSAARYGGEEFVALLPGTDAAGARLVADRVRASVESMGMAHEASDTASVVTVSVGYASVLPSVGDDPARLVDLADEALYRAKNSGRNRVSS